MSKPSRRASRAAQRNLGRPQPAAGPESAPTPPASPAPNALRGSGAAPASRPVGSRAGRREQRRPYRRPLMERYRGLLITIGVLAAIALIGVFFVISATAKAYTCGQIWNPDPSPSAAPGPTASGDLGYVQPDMGRQHSSDPQTYTYCPPASGTHINSPPNGPIPGRVYGPDDFAQPNGWIHNLEHGGRVILYKCPGPGCDDAGQAQLKALFQQLPNPANCATVVARFDEMKWPFAAVVWDRVLPLDTVAGPTITRFFNMYAGKTNPEALCPRPGASPGPSGSAGASGSPAASAPASVAPSGSGSAAPSASPS